jgi:acyl carrier protein
MSMDEAVLMVRESVSRICGAPLASLSADTRPQDIKGWDSFGRLQVVLEIERRLGRPVPLKEAVVCASIGALATLARS